MSGLVVHRSHHAQEFVVVPNAIARNAKLTFRARGLLTMLLSLPPDWRVTADVLAEDNPDSRTAIRAAMGELREAGYVVLVTTRGPDGRTRRHLEVYDVPQTKSGQGAFGDDQEERGTKSGHPAFGKPAVGIAAVIKKTEPKTEELFAHPGDAPQKPHRRKPKPRAAEPQPYSDPRFAEFWNAYPPCGNPPARRDKRQAWKAWLAALKRGADPQLIIKAAAAHRDDPARRPQFTKYAATWLNAESYADEQPEQEENWWMT